MNPGVPFAKALEWLEAERRYQTEKFNYEQQVRDLTDDSGIYWIQQFDSYIQRIPVYGLESPQGAQAAAKLAATAVGLLETLIAAGVEVPAPGHPSGELRKWEQ